MFNSIFRFLVGLDQAFNPIILGGSEDVTLSAQIGHDYLLLGKYGIARIVLDFIFLPFETQHCYRSLLVEIDEFPENNELILGLLKEKGIE